MEESHLLIVRRLRSRWWGCFLFVIGFTLDGSALLRMISMEHFMGKAAKAIIDHRSSKAVHAQLPSKGCNVAVSKVYRYDVFLEFF